MSYGRKSQDRWLGCHLHTFTFPMSKVPQHGEVGSTAPSKPFGQGRRTPKPSRGFARLSLPHLNSILQF